ncbi:hypothetical protein DO97_19965 [Neosynechococcus sphagnicola sy1]|uniref:Primosomal protein N' 3' DNA-binding domain-containing protein n=2 Tax=Neosynechococcus TaxID=1501143 RepID=A0A098TM40_9CYAN|nr:hypothetical protein DO97_19965 [Neosynechococcus sphagnicola sy1]
MTGSHWVEVLVDCPGAQGLYTYSLQPDQVVQPGDILSVPFGAQQVGAIAIRCLAQLPSDLPPDRVRPVEEVITPAFFPSHYWALLEQVAQYYLTPLIAVIRVALPPGLLGRSQRRIRLIPSPPSPTAELPLSAPAQQLLGLLQQQAAGDYSWRYLQQQVPAAPRGLRELQQRGWVESYLEPPTSVRPKQRQAVTLVTTPGYAMTQLSPRQQEVLQVLQGQGGELWLSDLLQRCRTSTGTFKKAGAAGLGGDSIPGSSPR